MLLGLYINSSNDTFSPCSHWPCLDPKAETVPTGPANGSIWLPEQFLCLVFWGQAGETLNASQVWKGLAAMLEGITSAPFAPHAPHPRSPPSRCSSSRSGLSQPWDSLIHLHQGSLEMQERLHPSARPCSLLRHRRFPVGTRAPCKELGWLVPNFLFPFTEP